jgi:hypothetical protein
VAVGYDYAMAMVTHGAMALGWVNDPLAPTIQLLHAVGFIDHHYMEFIFVLAARCAGLAWLRKPENAPWAATLALVFGPAPTIQNGVFILQLPLLITTFVLQQNAPGGLRFRFIGPTPQLRRELLIGSPRAYPPVRIAVPSRLAAAEHLLAKP